MTYEYGWMTEDQLIMARYLICEELYSANCRLAMNLTEDQMCTILRHKRGIESELSRRGICGNLEPRSTTNPFRA